MSDLLDRLAIPDVTQPEWLTAAQVRAAGWAKQKGWPTRKDEDWRYAPLVPLIAAAFERAGVVASDRRGAPVSGSPGAPQSAAGLQPGSQAPLSGSSIARMTFVNGRFSPEHSTTGKLSAGITVTSLASEIGSGALGLAGYFSPASGEFAHTFEAVNTAAAGDGAVVRVDADVHIDGLIELLYYSDGRGASHISQPRSIIVAGPRSRVSIVETYAGPAGSEGWTNAVTQVSLGAGAEVVHYKIQDEADSAFNLGLLDVTAQEGSRFSSLSVVLGSRVARNEVRVLLEGERAQVSLNGLYLPGGDRFHDNPVLVVHSARNCTSRQLYKGIASGQGHGVFNGHLVVLPGADGADAAQTNKNLLLSDHAEIDTRPRLQILTDDVKCSHGAAVGALDPDAIFYLRSRGVPLEQAKSILTAGFAAEILETVGDENLRARMEALVASRLNEGLALV